MEAKLYIGNLSKSTTQDELSTLFAHAGTVLRVKVIKDLIQGKSMGYAFITMSLQEEAEKAIDMFNLHLIHGHTLNVSIVNLRENRDVNASQMER